MKNLFQDKHDLRACYFDLIWRTNQSSKAYINSLPVRNIDLQTLTIRLIIKQGHFKIFRWNYAITVSYWEVEMKMFLWVSICNDLRQERRNHKLTLQTVRSFPMGVD